jgi:GH43 family beta-xylosidase
MLSPINRAATTQPSITFTNPLIPQRADPSCFLHTDGYYYFTATAPEYDRIELRRSKSIQDLGSADVKVIWRKHPTGIMGAHIWAPEIHFIDGKWFIYFAAGAAERIWDIRVYVLENASANPFDGEWIERGQLKTGWESFALDATTFVHRGVRYLVWAQKDPAVRNNSHIYIAKMDSPLTITGKAVMISKPDLPWERRGFRVNEGPAVLIRNGRVFMSYSASATDANYCMGLLTAKEDADLLDPNSWIKSAEPVLKTEESLKIFGPGHNCFTTTPDGKIDIMLYHARDYREIQGDPLRDPNRATRAQEVLWNEDGTPNLAAR